MKVEIKKWHIFEELGKEYKMKPEEVFMDCVNIGIGEYTGGDRWLEKEGYLSKKEPKFYKLLRYGYHSVKIISKTSTGYLVDMTHDEIVHLTGDDLKIDYGY